MSVRTGESRLILPGLAPGALSTKPLLFAPPEASPPESRTVVSPGETRRALTRDYVSGREEMLVIVDDGVQRIDEHGLEIGRRCEERYSIHPDDPLSACVDARWAMSLARGDWTVQTHSRATLTASETHFHVAWELQALHNGDLIHSDAGTTSVPRTSV